MGNANARRRYTLMFLAEWFNDKDNCKKKNNIEKKSYQGRRSHPQPKQGTNTESVMTATKRKMAQVFEEQAPPPETPLGKLGVAGKLHRKRTI